MRLVGYTERCRLLTAVGIWIKGQPTRDEGTDHLMEQPQPNWIVNFIWGIADDVLRDVYVRGRREMIPRSGR